MRTGNLEALLCRRVAGERITKEQIDIACAADIADDLIQIIKSSLDEMLDVDGYKPNGQFREKIWFQFYTRVCGIFVGGETQQ